MLQAVILQKKQAENATGNGANLSKVSKFKFSMIKISFLFRVLICKS
jgi:hypothetical protein